jgi:hypothetical protein
VATASFAAVTLLHMTAAVAAPPADATPNPALSDWFNSLNQPGTQRPCCSISDCRVTAYHVRDGHFEVTIDGSVHIVPNASILHSTNNPTGSAVVCYSYSSFGPPSESGQNGGGPQDAIEILCFIPPKALS